MENIEENSKKEFNSWAKTYDSFFNHWYFSHTNKKIVSLLEINPKSSILDVGCGTGILIENLIDKKYSKIYGIDISQEMVKMAKRKFSKNKKVKIFLGSAVKMPYKNNSFNFITCSNSFHHHPDSLKSLKEMYRILKPVGKLILLDAFKDGIIREIYTKIIQKFEGRILHYYKDEIYNLFKKVGFSQINQQNLGLLHLITIGEKM